MKWVTSLGGSKAVQSAFGMPESGERLPKAKVVSSTSGKCFSRFSAIRRCVIQVPIFPPSNKSTFLTGGFDTAGDRRLLNHRGYLLFIFSAFQIVRPGRPEQSEAD